MTIAVELTRAVDGPGVLAALTAGGLSGELTGDGCGLIVRGDDAPAVGHVLDAWASERGLPFVPVQVDPSSYALVPPAG
jgi:hypothetical protein